MEIFMDAITGNELCTDVTEPYSALVEFYNAFNRSDMALMQHNWSHGDDIVMSNPLGGVKRGWDEISTVYDRIFNGPASVYVEFYDFNIVQSDEMFCAMGRERGRFQMEDVSLDLAIRTSRLYRHDGERWRQLHHHGSIEQADLLTRYQAAVNNGSDSFVKDKKYTG